MSETILVTGGAGFIGSHLTDEFLQRGYQVRVLDALVEQVHGPHSCWPSYLSPDVDLVVGDVRDADTVERALQGVHGVVHLAAAVGGGQSIYAVEHFVSVNDVGTAVLMDAVAKRQLRKLVVASCMSLYGEGLYRRRRDAAVVSVGSRSREQLAAGVWDLVDENGEPLEPIPTPEDKQPDFASIYALTKHDQERMCLILGAASDVPTVALRVFNCDGPRQALSNPCSGVLAVFASRLLNRRPPLVFEDGRQMRDFVSVHDVARACRIAYERDDVEDAVFNVGSGRPRTVLDVAHAVSEALAIDIEPEVVGEYRVGDVRHCFADVRRAQEVLGYAAEVDFSDGLVELAQWLGGQSARDRAGVRAAVGR